MGASDSLVPFGLDYGLPLSSAYLDVDASFFSSSACVDRRTRPGFWFPDPAGFLSRRSEASHVAGSSLWTRAIDKRPAELELGSPNIVELVVAFGGLLTVGVGELHISGQPSTAHVLAPIRFDCFVRFRSAAAAMGRYKPVGLNLAGRGLAPR